MRRSLGLNVVREGNAVARGFVPQISTFDGASVFSSLSRDRLVYLAQTFHAAAGLCHPSHAGAIVLGRADATARTKSECPMSFPGEVVVGSATFAGGRLILGRTQITTDACNSQEFDPTTIETYAMP
jgi:hypothetical protein